MDIGIYAGSFDPITLGHLDIIERASTHVKRLFIAIADNPQKKHFLKAEQREALVKAATGHVKNITIVRCPKLVVNLVKEFQADVLIRGLRTAEDAAQEISMAAMNRERCGADTLFFASAPCLSHIQSRFVRDFLMNGEVPREFIPATTLEMLGSFLDSDRQ